MYGFKDHKGYPTKKHLEAIEKYGIFDEYRKTYGPVKKIIEKNKNRLNQNAKNIEKIALVDKYTVAEKVREMYKILKYCLQ